MTIKTEIQTILSQFEKDNAEYKEKAYLTSGSRTWKNQLEIIINPKRKRNYLNIKSRFKTKFKLATIPTTISKMTTLQLTWWQTEISKQAGKSPGFPHEGGKAQDISVKNMDLVGKKLLKNAIEATGLSILLEKVTGTISKYDVSIEKANAFHVYK